MSGKISTTPPTAMSELHSDHLTLGLAVSSSSEPPPAVATNEAIRTPSAVSLRPPNIVAAPVTSVTVSSFGDTAGLRWEKLGPQQFVELQEYISYAQKSCKEVMAKMLTGHQLEADGTIDYEEYTRFMSMYLDADVPSPLLQAVFRSLMKRRPTILGPPAQIKPSSVASDSSVSLVATDKPQQSPSLGSNRITTFTERLVALTEHLKPKIGSDQKHPLPKSPSRGLANLGEKSHSLGHLAVANLVETSANSGNAAGGKSATLESATPIVTIPFMASQSVDDLEAVGSSSNATDRAAFGKELSSQGNTALTSLLLSPSSGSDPSAPKILIRDLICYLSLLEAGRPEDKLEFLFRVYDTDGNGTLDASELEAIVNQMMNVAGYLGWECSELRPILEDMMKEIDVDDDGQVSLEEWKRGGLTTIPLLVLLGLEANVRDDGAHVWRLKHFHKTSYCNLCLNPLLGLGKKGLNCIFCHYTAHEKCVQWAPQSCIATYSKTRKTTTTLSHVWNQANVSGKCEKCRKTIKYGITGLRCRWCQAVVHNKCIQALPAECNLGALRDHILPPNCIVPIVLGSNAPSGGPSSNPGSAEVKQRRASHTSSSGSRRGSCVAAFGVPDPASNPAAFSAALGSRLVLPPATTSSGFSALPLQRASATSIVGRDSDTSNAAESSTGLSAATVGSPGTSRQLSATTSSQHQLRPTASSATNFSPLAAAESSAVAFMSRPAPFHIVPLPSTHPLLVFINPKSGGHQGSKILAKLQYLLNPRQVYNLIADRGPYNGLNFFRDVPNYRILVAGGDGTVGWLMDAIDKMKIPPAPIAILPLGTGNDLARCLRWGGGYEDEPIVPFLQQLSLGATVQLDRWRIEIEHDESDVPPGENTGDPIPFNIVNNYFSLGVDASIAHRFHTMRERHPEKFNSRMRNKLWYLELGTSETFSSDCKNLQENVSIWCDGELLDLSKVTPLEAIAVLNIPSIYGGSNLWGDMQLRRRDKKLAATRTATAIGGMSREMSPALLHQRSYGGGSSYGGSYSVDRDPDSSMSVGSDADFVIQDIGDSLFELVGLENTFHAASVYAGLRPSAIRLRQCQSCVIRTKRRFPMQIDGEPWLQPQCTIRITHFNQVPMIMAPKKKKKNPILKFFGIR